MRSGLQTVGSDEPSLPGLLSPAVPEKPKPCPGLSLRLFFLAPSGADDRFHLADAKTIHPKRAA